jgi:MoaA/NifB/PqqE/SkfB family radical SAM enzyme
MDDLTERLLKWADGKTAGPSKVQLNLTNRCNLKCRFCWLRDFDSSEVNYDELDTAKYFEIVEGAAAMGARSIEITGGGEPAFRKDLLDIMKEVKRRGLYGELITNGTMLADGAIQEIVAIRWDKIVFSLDGPDAETNDYLRGVPGSFEKTTHAIRTLAAAKSEAGKDVPETCIHLVLCNRNHDKIERMFRLAHELGCNNLFIEPVVILAPNTGAGTDLLIKDENTANLLLDMEKARNFAREYHFKTNLDQLRLELVDSVNRMGEIIMEKSKKDVAASGRRLISVPCYSPWYQMIVRPWGVVGPCCMFDNAGDNVKDSSLKKIWFGENFGKVRQKLESGLLPEFCSKCNPSQVQENMKIRDELHRYEKR